MPEMKLEKLKDLPYRVELRFDNEEQRWFAAYPELPGCEADGADKAEALRHGEEVKNLWLEMALEARREIPMPEPEISFSGRVLLRLPKSLHQRAVRCAFREGISLNTFVTQAVSESVERFGMRRIFGFFGATFRRAARDAVHQQGEGLYSVGLGILLKRVDRDEAVISMDTEPTAPKRVPLDNCDAAAE